PSIAIITMNPNSSFLKEKYYVPWKNGNLPKDVRVIEYTIDDSWQDKKDIEAMLRNPKPWVERYVNNNWNYEDDQDSLFKYRFFDAAITTKLDLNDTRFAGYDVARSGADRSVFSLWYGNTLVDILVVKGADEQMTTDVQADELVKLITQNAVLPENTWVDSVGIGVGVIDGLKPRGIDVKEFISGGRPTDEYVDKY